MTTNVNLIKNPTGQTANMANWYASSGVSIVTGGSDDAKCFQLTPNSVMYQYIQGLIAPVDIEVIADFIPPPGFTNSTIKMYLEVRAYYSDGSEDDFIFPITKDTVITGTLAGASKQWYRIDNTIKLTKDGSVSNIKVQITTLDTAGNGFVDNLQLFTVSSGPTSDGPWLQNITQGGLLATFRNYFSDTMGMTITNTKIDAGLSVFIIAKTFANLPSHKFSLLNSNINLVVSGLASKYGTITSPLTNNVSTTINKAKTYDVLGYQLIPKTTPNAVGLTYPLATVVFMPSNVVIDKFMIIDGVEASINPLT